MKTHSVDNPTSQIAGVILAGGESRRMGGKAKALLTLDDKSLLQVLVEKIDHQVAKTYLNLSKALLAQVQSQAHPIADCAESRDTEKPEIMKQNTLSLDISREKNLHNQNIILDDEYSMQGPLAGVISAMKHVRGDTSIEYVLSVPVDSPFIPLNLARVLLDSINGYQAVYAQSQNREHYAVGLWSKTLLSDIEIYLKNGDRSVGRFLKNIRSKPVTFIDEPFDPFFNINTPEDFDKAKILYKSLT